MFLPFGFEIMRKPKLVSRRGHATNFLAYILLHHWRVGYKGVGEHDKKPDVVISYHNVVMP